MRPSTQRSEHHKRLAARPDWIYLRSCFVRGELRQCLSLPAAVGEERECAWISHAGPTPTKALAGVGAMNGLKGDLLQTHIVCCERRPLWLREWVSLVRVDQKGAIHLLAPSHHKEIASLQRHTHCSSNLLLSHYNRQLILWRIRISRIFICIYWKSICMKVHTCVQGIQEIGRSREAD